MTNYEALPNQTRIWIYQSSRSIRDHEVPVLKEQINLFVERWVSHNQKLRAYGDIYHNRFIVLMVDESQAGASGCSIDSSVHFVKQIGEAMGVDFFDRMTFAYQSNDKVKVAPQEEFARLYKQGLITDETLVFDNLVDNKAAFESEWVKPLGTSWHRRLI